MNPQTPKSSTASRAPSTTKNTTNFTYDVLPRQARSTAPKIKVTRKTKAKTTTLNWDAIIADSKKTTKPARQVEAADATKTTPSKSTHQFSKFIKPTKTKKTEGPTVKSSSQKGSLSKHKARPHAEDVIASEGIRLNKLIANFSTYSRRQADTFIESGKVTLNSQKITELGCIVAKPQNVRIEVNGVLIKTQQRTQSIVMNKPKDCISTRRDEKGRRTIYDVLPEELKGLKPVGRLDRNSTGLLLLTNDGDMVNLLTHPKYHFPKVYRVELDRVVSNPEALAKKLLEGILLDGETQIAQATEVFMVKPTIWGISINAGMYRQVRRMFEACQYDVKSLKRIAMGNFQLSGLKPGEWRELRYNEVQSLKNSALAAFKEAEKIKRLDAKASKINARLAREGRDSVEKQMSRFLSDLDPKLEAEFI
ncbi:MAG: rRNA pseudouridine synthase [Vampirovibrio sp.]